MLVRPRSGRRPQVRDAARLRGDCLDEADVLGQKLKALCAAAAPLLRDALALTYGADACAFVDADWLSRTVGKTRAEISSFEIDDASSPCASSLRASRGPAAGCHVDIPSARVAAGLRGYSEGVAAAAATWIVRATVQDGPRLATTWIRCNIVSPSSGWRRYV